MTMLVSHESPKHILNASREYNDYDYALVHLFEDHEDYFQFFKKSIQMKRTVYLDNSIFELKESFEPSEYIKWIERLKPSLYIVPDVLEDSDGTICQFEEWESNFASGIDFNVIKMGVVQGHNWKDLVECYRFMSKHADMIAISFDYTYYELTAEGDNPLERMCNGRQRFIHQLKDEGIWNKSKPHHLLGCSLAREFSKYTSSDYNNIVSVDTSNPIVAAIKRKQYKPYIGLDDKPRVMLADLIDEQLDTEQLRMVEYNTSHFKKIINR